MPRDSKIQQIERLTQDERKRVKELLQDANQLAQKLIEVAFANKHTKAEFPYSGVWLARGGGYPIVGRFFLVQTLDSISGYVESESRAKISGKCNESKFDLTVQWANGDITHVGNGYNEKQRQLEPLQGRMNGAMRATLNFPYVHNHLDQETGQYASPEHGYKGSLQRLSMDAKAKGLYDKLLGNMDAVSQLYENVSFKRLAGLFNMDQESAEAFAQCLLKSGQVTGSIDQVDQMVIFEKPREALSKFNTQVREVCTMVQKTYDVLKKKRETKVTSSSE